MTTRIPIPEPDNDWAVPWQELQGYAWVQAWKDCPQDPTHHAEGNVWIHTEMVLSEMAADPTWRALPAPDREIAYLAAVFHDVAKPSTSRVHDDGRITTRGHSRRGAIDTRRILWEMGYPFAVREAVCALILYHQVPYFLIDEARSMARLAKISQTARCGLLQILATADIKGRICQDADRALGNIELFGLYAEEHGCLHQPMAFSSDHARFRFFHGGSKWAAHGEVYDDTQCEVVVMSGLPGSGKNHWIARRAPDWPIVSLDAIRRELGVSPTDDQGTVKQVSLERAREHLRRGQSFIWNATNLDPQRRASLIRLFDDYKARVRFVYVEATAERLFIQNRERAHPVPEKVIHNMMRRWQVPDLTEAHQVEYVTGEGE